MNLPTKERKQVRNKIRENIFLIAQNPVTVLLNCFFKHAKRSEEDCKTLYIINLLEYSKISSYL